MFFHFSAQKDIPNKIQESEIVVESEKEILSKDENLQAENECPAPQIENLNLSYLVKFKKMVQVGVPPNAVKLKMIAEGCSEQQIKMVVQ